MGTIETKDLQRIIFMDLEPLLNTESLKQKFFNVSEFHVPTDLTRPMRYTSNVLKTCETNRDATNDTR